MDDAPAQPLTCKKKRKRMKNALLIWNVLLTLLTGYLLFQQFGGSGKKQDTAQNGSSAEGMGFRIAYFEMDSIENNFDKVKDVKKEIADKDEYYNSELAKLEARLNRKKQSYQQQSATMTEQDYNNAMIDLQRLEKTLAGEKQLLDTDYQDFIFRRNLAVRKEIEDYIAKYNKDKGFSYVISYEPGLFYYRDTLYNITADLVKGLNETYKTNKDKK